MVFAGAELLAPVVGLWEPTGDTARLLGVAVYVPPAEAVLGWAAAVGHRASAGRALGVKIGAAAAVSCMLAAVTSTASKKPSEQHSACRLIPLIRLLPSTPRSPCCGPDTTLASLTTAYNFALRAAASGRRVARA